ncbi:hypothetical protein PhaeoP75_04457 (plasmid) [Phaeobacter gallaeciensis]|uniref:Uncharacterized protein n=1 Tax=Phaeobacter gallaeciensis TaxID=60890 RepID=A0AAC9ZDL9_9RHOB|nr:hypothetical protein [Phaeobacter gallaeciensis]ATF04056.1 hypothetical protein PhaeoP75_04457 [Phaeobacter gallaeciensis]ATF08332.1 hypothetical protein PhaeoP63_04302 [Phaeobacter gallaeciensis]
MSSQVFLTVEDRQKDIPYPPETHQDSQNFGFKPLKGKSEKVDKIQEAKGFPGIIAALKAINVQDSPFFSIGCEKYIGPEQYGGYYARGYIEFAFNYARMVSFPQAADLFRCFSIYYAQHEIYEYTTYNFDIQPAYFVKAKTDGYTCCVWIRTGHHASHKEAEQAYNKAVQLLADFISTVGPPENEPERIY